MVFRGIAVRLTALHKRALATVLGTLVVAGCVDEPRPRSYQEFMDDPIAREGTLARCNQDRAVNAGDLECVNARRAASTTAARAEAARAEQFEAESDIKREALRDRVGAQQLAARRIEEEAKKADEASYAAQWEDSPQAPPSQGASNFGSPVAAPRSETRDTEVQQFDGSPSANSQPPVEPRVAERDQLSYVEVPPIESPVAKQLAELRLPPIATRRELQPQLEELTITEQYRYPEDD